MKRDGCLFDYNYFFLIYRANYGKCIGKKEWTNMNESLKGIIGKI